MKQSLVERCRFNVEHTDTFGGEANYAWCNRRSIEAPAYISDRALLRRAKKLVGLNGVRGRVERYGDEIRFYPFRMAQVVFINVAY